MLVRCSNHLSANGYLARPDGREDFLPDEGWYEFVEEAERFNNFIIGRETFDIVSDLYHDFGFDDVKAAHKLIVTSRADFTAPGFTVVHSPETALEYLRKHKVETAFLIGGGRLNSSFAQRGLIDEVELTLCPYLLGEGRPWFYPADFEAKLDLKACEQLSGGRLRLLYKVLYTQPAERTPTAGVWVKRKV